MSKDNRTLLKFNTNLDAEYSWRRKELTLFKSKIDNASSFEQSALLRSSLAMFYAHWEGFVKASASHFLNYVSLRRLKLEELQPNFIALCVKAKMNFFDSNKFKLHHEAVEYLLNNLDKRSLIPYRSEIDTKSNLSFAVFTDICFLLGINLTVYSIHSKLIDSLVNKRNNIAHGRNLIMDATDFHKYHDTIVELLNRFKNDLYDAAQSEKYKRAS